MNIDIVCCFTLYKYNLMTLTGSCCLRYFQNYYCVRQYRFLSLHTSCLREWVAIKCVVNCEYPQQFKQIKFTFLFNFPSFCFINTDYNIQITSLFILWSLAQLQHTKASHYCNQKNVCNRKHAHVHAPIHISLVGVFTGRFIQRQTWVCPNETRFKTKCSREAQN